MNLYYSRDGKSTYFALGYTPTYRWGNRKVIYEVLTCFENTIGTGRDYMRLLSPRHLIDWRNYEDSPS